MSEYQKPVEDPDSVKDSEQDEDHHQASKIPIVKPVMHRKGRPKNMKSYVKWNAKRKFCKKSLIQNDDSCMIVDTKSITSYIRDWNQVAKAMLCETISFEQLDLTKLDSGDWLGSNVITYFLQLLKRHNGHVNGLYNPDLISHCSDQRWVIGQVIT